MYFLLNIGIPPLALPCLALHLPAGFIVGALDAPFLLTTCLVVNADTQVCALAPFTHPIKYYLDHPRRPLFLNRQPPHHTKNLAYTKACDKRDHNIHDLLSPC